MNGSINIDLVTSPDELKFSELSEFMIGLKITNYGSNNEHVDVSETVLYVNGNRNSAWDLAVQNGTIINLKLNAKSDKLVEWPLGDALFPSPGKYDLKLVWGSTQKTKQIRVK